jgi:hypothetical protein
MNPLHELRRLLDAWPDGHVDLYCTHQLEDEDGSLFERYTTGLKTFIVTRFERGGWEIYLPASESNRIPDTMASVVEYLTGWRPL